MDITSLDKFLIAQDSDYQKALQEVKSGKKVSHWIWYIFPQIAGLGHSYMCHTYDIPNLQTAKAYLENSTLRERLFEVSNALLELPTDDPIEVFGVTDSMKVKSCMTLFERANPSYNIFSRILDKFYDGVRDERTLEILESQAR